MGWSPRRPPPLHCEPARPAVQEACSRGRTCGPMCSNRPCAKLSGMPLCGMPWPLNWCQSKGSSPRPRVGPLVTMACSCRPGRRGLGDEAQAPLAVDARVRRAAGVWVQTCTPRLTRRGGSCLTVRTAGRRVQAAWFSRPFCPVASFPAPHTDPPSPSARLGCQFGRGDLGVVAPTGEGHARDQVAPPADSAQRVTLRQLCTGVHARCEHRRR